jgi:four helix bundle protein
VTRKAIESHRDLEVYGLAFDAAMRIFDATRGFPVEERYALTDQMRRSSRSVCANLVETWRKRRYPAVFQSKLSDAEAEAAEKQVWLEFAVRCGYLDTAAGRELYQIYDHILGKLVVMISRSEDWRVQSGTQ